MSDVRIKPLDLQDLALLNQEIAALVRAGVPLESGLVVADAGGAAQELLMLRLSQRLREGQSLGDALQMEGAELPRVYRAIVQAGTRTGRLADALESLTGYAQATLELRRRIDVALLYPALVLLLAAFLFSCVIAFWVPVVSETYWSLGFSTTRFVRSLEWLREQLLWWVGLVPAGLLVLAIWWWASTRGRYGLRGATDCPDWSALSLVPGLRAIVRNYRRANFCDLLALMLEHQVPLSDAAPLAADATGDASLRRAAGRIADGVRSGHSLADCLVVGRELPPFLSWMLVSGERQGNLTAMLRQVADVARRRATAQSDWLKILLPTALVVVVGGSAVLIYAVTVFGPMAQLLWKLGGFNA